MSRKVFIMLLATALIAGLAAQAVADYQYNYLSSCLYRGRAASIVLNGNTGFELSGYGVTALDLTNLAAPTFISRAMTPGFSYTGALVGTDLIVADGNALSILDVADSTQMEYQSYLALPGSVRSVAAITDWAFCAVDGPTFHGLKIVNIQDPIHPYVATSVTLNGNAYFLTYAQNHVYVAVGSAGLAVVNVTDPLNPGTPHYADTPGTAYGVAVELTQNLAMLADGDSGVARVDITTPDNPVYLSPEVHTQTKALQITFGPTFAAVSEVRSDSSVGFVQFFGYTGTPMGSYHPAGLPQTVTISDTNAFVCQAEAGIAIVDITDLSHPSLTGMYAEPLGGPVAMARDGNYAYVADYLGGLKCVDFTNITQPVVVGSFATGLYCYDVFVVGSTVYALDFNRNLVLVDITDPSHPDSLNRVQMYVSQTRSMAYANGYIYIGAYHNYLNQNLLTYDISTLQPASNPIGTDSADIKGITVAGGYLFAAATDSGVYIYDITTDPTTPARVGHFPTTGMARMTSINGNTMYVAVQGEGMVTVDITDHTNPVQIGNPYTFNGSVDTYGVAYAGNNKVYVAFWGAGVDFVDVSTPASPVDYGNSNTPGLAYEPFVWGQDTLMVCDYYSLEVGNITTVAVYPTPETHAPVTFKLHGASPNPFNGRTMISFALPVSGKVDVAVYDAMGRIVAQPFSGNLSAGEHRLPFNAEGFSSGMYIVKVSSPWGEQSGKMVLLK